MHRRRIYEVMELLLHILLACLTANASHHTREGSGQGSGPQDTYVLLSTATQSLLFPSLSPVTANGIPVSTEEPLRHFSEVASVLPSSLTPSLFSPLSSVASPSESSDLPLYFFMPSSEHSAPLITSFGEAASSSVSVGPLTILPMTNTLMTTFSRTVPLQPPNTQFPPSPAPEEAPVSTPALLLVPDSTVSPTMFAGEAISPTESSEPMFSSNLLLLEPETSASLKFTTEPGLMFVDIIPTISRLMLGRTSSPDLRTLVSEEAILLIPESTLASRITLSLSTMESVSTPITSVVLTLTEAAMALSTSFGFFFAATPQPIASSAAQPRPQPTSVDPLLLFPMESDEVAALPVSSFTLLMTRTSSSLLQSTPTSPAPLPTTTAVPPLLSLQLTSSLGVATPSTELQPDSSIIPLLFLSLSTTVVVSTVIGSPIQSTLTVVPTPSLTSILPVSLPTSFLGSITLPTAKEGAVSSSPPPLSVLSSPSLVPSESPSFSVSSSPVTPPGVVRTSSTLFVTIERSPPPAASFSSTLVLLSLSTSNLLTSASLPQPSPVLTSSSLPQSSPVLTSSVSIPLALLPSLSSLNFVAGLPTQLSMVSSFSLSPLTIQPSLSSFVVEARSSSSVSDVSAGLSETAGSTSSVEIPLSSRMLSTRSPSESVVPMVTTSLLTPSSLPMSLQTRSRPLQTQNVLLTQQISSEIGSPLSGSSTVLLSFPSSLVQSLSSSSAIMGRPSSSAFLGSVALVSTPLQPTTRQTSVVRRFSTSSEPSQNVRGSLSSSTPVVSSMASLGLTASPVPFGCPSFLQEGEEVPSSSLVQLRFGLTMSKHNLISEANSAERCELEEGLVNAVFGEESVNLVARTQTTGSRGGYDADITDVGMLTGGTAVVTFYIINATGVPTFVPATVVIGAIQSRNLTQVLTYPIIGIEAPPTSSAPSVVPIAAGFGVALFLLVVTVVTLVVCVSVLYYNGHKTVKVETLRGTEAGATFATTDDFGQFSEEQSTSDQPAKPVPHPVSLSLLANGWVGDRDATPTMARETPSSSKCDRVSVPAGLFERVAHYDSVTPPQASPSTRALKLKFRNSVAPSPSTSHKSHSSEAEPFPVRTTPSALKTRHKSNVVRETVEMKEESLREQEQREEDEIKARRKATLERLLLQTRQRDSEIRSRIGSRRRKRHGSVGVDTTIHPSTYGGAMSSAFWDAREPEVAAVMGDVESTSPFASPHPADVMATSPSRPTTRPLTKRRLARRKDNKVVPEVTTDDYDSTDHAPHPYHLMMEPHNLHGSRRGSRRKTGLSRRGRRPLTREQTRLTSSRKHRAVSRDVHRELAWMETPGGVQLMRIQPILPTAVPPPTFNLPPPHAPMAPGQVITVQPRPQPKATFPSPRHLDNLPALAPPTSQTLTHRQLETLWREIEKFQLDQTMRSTAKQATPTEHVEAPIVKPSNGGSKEAGDGGEDLGGDGGAITSEGVDSKVKKREESEQPLQLSQPTQHGQADHPATVAAAATTLPDIDSSYSSAVIQEFLQQAFSASQSQGAGQTWGRSTNSNFQDSQDSGVTSHGRVTAGAWHSDGTPQPMPQAVAPTSLYGAPPIHYGGLPGQLVWAPPDSQSFTALHTAQVVPPSQLTQLRQSTHTFPNEYDHSGHIHDPYQPTAPVRTHFAISPYSRYQQRYDPFT